MSRSGRGSPKGLQASSILLFDDYINLYNSPYGFRHRQGTGTPPSVRGLPGWPGEPSAEARHVGPRGVLVLVKAAVPMDRFPDRQVDLYEVKAGVEGPCPGSGSEGCGVRCPARFAGTGSPVPGLCRRAGRGGRRGLCRAGHCGAPFPGRAKVRTDCPGPASFVLPAPENPCPAGRNAPPPVILDDGSIK